MLKDPTTWVSIVSKFFFAKTKQKTFGEIFGKCIKVKMFPNITKWVPETLPSKQKVRAHG